MKKLLTTMILAATAITTNAQWNNWHTTQAISGGFGIIGSIRA